MLWNQIVRVGLLGLAIGATCLGLADDDEHGEHEGRSQRRTIAVASNPQYQAECASCHMLYPPGLLPARSWQAMMGGLKNHFGDNAALDEKTTAELTQFLVKNAADQSSASRSQKIAQSIKDVPLRFTETAYFKRKHHEISSQIWQRKAIGSPAKCVACHSRAEAGIFDEDEVRIPR